MQKLVIINPPTCTTVTPVISNIDFGQPSWTGDDEPSDPIAVGSAIMTSVSFKYVGSVHEVKWTWGDGTPATTGSSTDETGTSTDSHSYLNAGIYTVSLTVTDDCGIAEVTRQVVVYDPSGGFVTGGGWIDSPPGAYPADPTLAGRANFGFVSKYLKGATVPIGQTEFQFQTAKLNFHSESYDWLVVAGARAQYTGTGSVNGNSGFSFRLTVVDGALLADGRGVDRFRIKIWHTDPNNKDGVGYDNQTTNASLEGGTSEGTEISGGSIVIHK